LALNTTELLEEPFRVIFSPFTDIFGNSFFLLLLIFLSGAVYMKTRELAVTGMFMFGSGALLAAGDIFAGHGNIALISLLFAAFGVGIVIWDILGMRR